jgi:hypothetical protein
MKLNRLYPFVAIALFGCESPNDPGTGGVTRAEAEQLNEVAEELNPDDLPPRLTNQQMATPVPPE